MKAEPRLRLNHYKWVHGGGVLGARSLNEIVLDDALQRQYGPILRQRLNMSKNP